MNPRRRWRELPLRQRTLLLLLIPSAALLLGFVLLFSVSRVESQAVAWANQALQLRDGAHALLEPLMEAETGVRAFAATDGREFLAPFHQLKDHLPRRLGQLERYAAGDPRNTAAVQQLRRLVEERVELMRRTIDSVGRERAATISLVHQGRAAMDQVRSHVRQMSRSSEEEYAARQQRLERIRSYSLATSAGSVALGVLGGAVAMLLFARDMASRLRLTEQNATRLAQEEPLLPMRGGRDELGALEQALITADRLLQSRTHALRAAREELQQAVHMNDLVLRNSRDVICTIDAAGRFRTVSAAARQVFGYQPEELVGRAYMDFVHPDDHEKTRAIAESIMHGNSVTDFDNCYIRKDGTAVDVTWSAYWSSADSLMFCVARDTTERTRAARELKRAQKEAERANHAKSEFLSRMSHELRTPLNAILGFAQLMETEPHNADDAESIEQILRAGRHLLGLINDVLDFSRIEAGRLSISPEAVSLPGVLQQCAELMQPLAKPNQITILLPESSGTQGYVRADRQRLTQVLLNLLANAVKYNRPRGTVTLSFHTRGDRTRIQVRDTGRGISDADTQRLFDPFDRLGADTDAAIEGTGLGLALSKRLVELMGGSIGVQSEPNVGSTFWVDLPPAADPLQAHEIPELPAHAAPADGPSAHTILHIEDNPSNLKLVERVLQSSRRNVRLLATTTGAAGIRLAREQLPDVVLLDLNLPDTTGRDVLTELRNDPATAAIPVVIISADAMDTQIRRLLAAGAADYLVKPLDVRKFLETIDAQLQTVCANGDRV